MRENFTYSELLTAHPVPCLTTNHGYHFRAFITNDHVFDLILYNYYVPEALNLVGGLDSEVPDNIEEAYLKTLNLDQDYAFPNLLTYQSPTLTSFFSTQMIDIPLCLQTTNSLYFPIASSPQLRFVNMLMRHGRRSYASNCYSRSLHTTANLLMDAKDLPSNNLDWRFTFGLFSQFKVGEVHSSHTNGGYLELNALDSVTDKYSQSYLDEGHEPKLGRWLHDILFTELLKYSPLFSFYVKKVDKSKRKHSRGKSGKYSISWKYVPQYRRMFTVLRWLAKDVRFQKSKTFHGRILKSLECLFFSTKTHLVYQLRQFVHTFVFQNHKKTLLRTLRSTA